MTLFRATSGLQSHAAQSMAVLFNLFCLKRYRGDEPHASFIQNYFGKFLPKDGAERIRLSFLLGNLF